MIPVHATMVWEVGNVVVVVMPISSRQIDESISIADFFPPN
jgi:hypothetical protein